MDLTDYRVKVYTPYMKYISHPMTMVDAIRYMAEKLDVLHALDCLAVGLIPDSTCVFTGDAIYHKTYVVIVNVPYTKLVLKKYSKGSFDIDELMTTIKYVKEEYGRNKNQIKLF